MAASHVIPLFPLGTVLLPGTALPLHIFEERYKAMIADIERSNKDFGIVYYNGATLKKYGASARMLGLVHSYADGRMDILTSGIRRFEIVRIEEGGLYLRAEVKFFEDKSEDILLLHDLSDRLLGKLETLADLSDKKFDRAATSKLKPEILSFVLGSTDLLSLEERQWALESRSPRKRLEKLLSAATKSVERARSAKQLHDVLGLRGDVSHLFN